MDIICCDRGTVCLPCFPSSKMGTREYSSIKHNRHILLKSGVIALETIDDPNDQNTWKCKPKTLCYLSLCLSFLLVLHFSFGYRWPQFLIFFPPPPTAASTMNFLNYDIWSPHNPLESPGRTPIITYFIIKIHAKALKASLLREWVEKSSREIRRVHLGFFSIAAEGKMDCRTE